MLCPVSSFVDRVIEKFSIANSKFVSIDNVTVPANDTGTNIQLKSDVIDHDLSIQVGDTIYVCRYHTPSGTDLSWLKNRDVQVRVKGKVMYMKKSNGKDAQASIVSTSKAPQP